VSALRVEGLSATLGQRAVLRDISFSVDAGELVGLIGPNGAGKSTLLKSLAGLLPAEGTVTLGTSKLSEISAQERARLVSYLPQDRDVAWPITVEKLVALGRTPYLAPMSGLGPHDKAMVDLALEQADAAYLRNRVVSELSGGERARVLIARALAQEAPLFVGDEPAAGLDPAHQISMMGVFASLATGGRAIIVALHEIALAAQWCSRLLLLCNGKLVADGEPRVVLTPEIFETVYGVRANISSSADGFLVQPVARVASRVPSQ
jgi:iron complex transport system ATP-binding protein